MDRRRLERILKVKERLETIRRAELAEAAQQRRAAESQAASTAAAYESAVVELTEAPAVSASELQDRAHFVVLGRERHVAAEVVAETRRGDESERAHHVSLVARDIKALDRLRDKLLVQERRRRGRAEQEASDEAASRGVGNREVTRRGATSRRDRKS